MYFQNQGDALVSKDMDTETCFRQRTGKNQVGQGLQTIPKEVYHLVNSSH